jgi:hypothetical protein
LPMNQHAWRPITFGMKGSFYLCLFMYLCKWNHASSEKNFNCGSISLSTTDCRNQLQKLTLLAGLCGCKAWVDYCCFIVSKLRQLCCFSCTRIYTPASWARGFSDSLGVCWSLPITVAAWSKAWTVFARPKARIVASNPTQGMDVCIVCVYSVFVLFCV